MHTEPITIRAARPADAAELLKIYAPYVEETTVTFEYDVPTLADFTGRIAGTLEKYPYLVAEQDGEILGYAYAAPFRSREAYIWAVEESVYVRRDKHRNGIGRLLYMELERLLRAQNVASVNACISYPNRDSVKFHSSLDFERVARFTKCAYKLDQWVDIVWMQKVLTESDAPPAPFIPYPALPEEIKP